MAEVEAVLTVMVAEAEGEVADSLVEVLPLLTKALVSLPSHCSVMKAKILLPTNTSSIQLQVI